MTCSFCEKTFQFNQTVIVSIEESASNAYLSVSNQGRNIVMIRRILLCYKTAFGAGILYLRPPPDSISWIYPSAFLETGISALYYKLPISSYVQIVQAQAEYIEIAGRSRSCAFEV
jgi:hypothetical protein